jgi:hypothetical protein
VIGLALKVCMRREKLEKSRVSAAAGLQSEQVAARHPREREANTSAEYLLQLPTLSHSASQKSVTTVPPARAATPQPSLTQVEIRELDTDPLPPAYQPEWRTNVTHDAHVVMAEREFSRLSVMRRTSSP